MEILIVFSKNLEYWIKELESISNPDINRIEIVRDRVGNWRVIIDEHYTDVYVDGRNKIMALAIEEVLLEYNKIKA